MKNRLSEMTNKAKFYLFDDKVLYNKYSYFDMFIGGSATAFILSGFFNNIPKKFNQFDYFLMTLGTFAVLGGIEYLKRKK